MPKKTNDKILSELNASMNNHPTYGAIIIEQVLTNKRKSISLDDFLTAMDVVSELDHRPEFQTQNRYMLKHIIAQLIKAYAHKVHSH